jgi:hypothetical protein
MGMCDSSHLSWINLFNIIYFKTYKGSVDFFLLNKYILQVLFKLLKLIFN